MPELVEIRLSAGGSLFPRNEADGRAICIRLRHSRSQSPFVPFAPDRNG